MTKRMFIDATNAEETRVVVLEGNRLEDFDVETQSRRQLKGNIYLAKVVRVEPSLQAAFVEYGGNRHGFLAFGEIHPDYYQIPVADRQRLLQMQEDEARAEEEAYDGATHASPDEHAERAAAAPPDLGDASAIDVNHLRSISPTSSADERDDVAAEAGTSEDAPALTAQIDDGADGPGGGETAAAIGADLAPETADLSAGAWASLAVSGAASHSLRNGNGADHGSEPDDRPRGRVEDISGMPEPPPEVIGGEQIEADELRERAPSPRFLRNYKIQEVIRRRQILLVQVVKEERGTKGAALTTYISLAGRYCVLMPNSPRGGGISRKITSAADRRRLKEITAEIDIPRGMGIIVRTAGANRPKPEIKRDCEYLLRLWDEIRDQTLQSIAPALIHEEASLIKRAIRDVYSREVEEILVDGTEGWKQARDYMRLLMPTHLKKVQLWREPQPLFAGQNIEQQLDSILSPTVQLRSGGYLVIDQTEALVAIDVNSGRSTRERGIEETALRTNLEAAEEVARQVRLRDLAGLIVVDFIDMESKRNVGAVERRLKEALKDDRARIQVGSISHFGLLEMSRQRLRPSLAETTLTICPHCNGAGRIRSTESAALHVLRCIEDEGGKRRAAEICVHVAPGVAIYILNHKRARLTEIESRWNMHIAFAADAALQPAQLRIERLRPQTQESPLPRPLPVEEESVETDAIEVEEEVAEDPEVSVGNGVDDAERRRRRRRRRRRGGRSDDATLDARPMPQDAEQPELGDVEFPGARPVLAGAAEETAENAVAPSPVPGHNEAAEVQEMQAKAPRRARKSGRRSRRDDSTTQDSTIPAYAGPTPADPFAGGALDIFEVMERAEAQGPAVAPIAPPPAATAQVPEVPMAGGLEPSSTDVPLPDGIEPASPDSAAGSALADPVIGPVIQPIVIGAGEPVSERKRGWWRR